MGLFDKLKNISDVASNLSGIMPIQKEKQPKVETKEIVEENVPDTVVDNDGRTVISTIDGMSSWLQGLQGGNMTPSATQALQSQIQVLNFVKSPALTGMAVDTMIMCLYKALQASNSVAERDSVRESFALMIQSFMFFNEAQLQYAINSNKEEGRQLLTQAGDILSKSVMSVATLVATGGLAAGGVAGVVVKNVFSGENGQQSFFGKIATFIGNKKMIEEKKKQHVDTLKNMFNIFDQYAELIGPSIVLHGMLGRYGSSLVDSYEEQKFKPLLSGTGSDSVSNVVSSVMNFNLTAVVAGATAAVTDVFQNKKNHVSGYDYLKQNKENSALKLQKCEQDLDNAQKKLHTKQKEYDETSVIRISLRNDLKEEIKSAEFYVEESKRQLKNAEQALAQANQLLEKGEVLKSEVDAYRADIERIVNKYKFNVSTQQGANANNNVNNSLSSAQVNTPPPSPIQTTYYVSVNGQTTGSFSVQQLKEMTTRGEFTRDSLVWCQGMDDWEKAINVSELSRLFGAIPPPPPKM